MKFLTVQIIIDILSIKFSYGFYGSSGQTYYHPAQKPGVLLTLILKENDILKEAKPTH
jgi:hypothetical protein